MLQWLSLACRPEAYPRSIYCPPDVYLACMISVSTAHTNPHPHRAHQPGSSYTHAHTLQPQSRSLVVESEHVPEGCALPSTNGVVLKYTFSRNLDCGGPSQTPFLISIASISFARARRHPVMDPHCSHTRIHDAGLPIHTGSPPSKPGQPPADRKTRAESGERRHRRHTYVPIDTATS